MSVPIAREMASALISTGRALQQKGVTNSEHIFHSLARAIQEHGADHLKWGYSIDKANPVLFKWVHNEHLNKNIRPRLYASIEVQQSTTGGVCFAHLDLALDIIDDENNVLIKHHIDLANSPAGNYQSGPLFHLQFGGHTPNNNRAFEVPLKEPRWLCFPLDVVLLCEVIVANFYPDDWAELKQLPSWNAPILVSQKLCITPYLEALQQKISTSTNSLLDHMWASKIGPTYMQNGFP